MRCADEPEHLLALAPNWVGDAVMCTPALRALKNAFPQARLTVAGRGAVCALLEGLPWVDALHPLPARPGAGELFRHARALAPAARDLAVVFPHSFRTALLARLAGARRRAGQDRNGRGFLLTEHVSPHRVDGRITPVYMAFEYLDVAEAAGGKRDGLGPELAAPADLRAELAERFDGAGPLVALAPGAAYGPSKQWPADRFAALADRLQDTCGARCVLLTGPGEEDTRRAVLAAARHPLLECPGRASTCSRPPCPSRACWSATTAGRVMSPWRLGNPWCASWAPPPPPIRKAPGSGAACCGLTWTAAPASSPSAPRTTAA